MISFDSNNQFFNFFPWASFREGRSQVAYPVYLENISLLFANQFEISLRLLVVNTEKLMSHQISVQSLYNCVLNYIRICSSVAQLDHFPFSAPTRLGFILLGWSCWSGFFACVITSDYSKIATWWSVQIFIKQFSQQKHQYWTTMIFWNFFYSQSSTIMPL